MVVTPLPSFRLRHRNPSDPSDPASAPSRQRSSSKKRLGAPRGLLARVRAAVATWAWATAAGKLLLWTAAFVALAHIGSGSVQRLLAATPLPESWSSSHLRGLDTTTVRSPIDGRSPASVCATGSSGCRPADAGADAARARPPKSVTDDGRVILNLATEGDLVQLPGIGVKRAQAIVALRNRLGRFRRVEDLLRVRGLGPRLLRRLRPHVTIDPPDPPGPTNR